MRMSLAPVAVRLVKAVGVASALGLVCAAPFNLRAADMYWTNYGSITEPPQIDAVNFVNFGEIEVSTSLPFQTSHTLNYTNYGNMYGAVGFRFDYGPSSLGGGRTPAKSFYNDNQGWVEAIDSSATFILIGPPSGTGTGAGGASVSPSNPSHLWVNAEQIVNKGTLTTGANGWLLLSGRDVNLSRGGVRVATLVGQGSFNIADSNWFMPDIGIDDLYWGGTNADFPSGGIWNGSEAAAPRHQVTRRGGFPGPASFRVQAPLVSDSITTVDGIMVSVTNYTGSNAGPTIPNPRPQDIRIEEVFIPTNELRQAAFVGINDPERQTASIAWAPSDNPTNLFYTPAIEIIMPAGDLVTLEPSITSLYFYDTLASGTNRAMFGNLTRGNGGGFTSFRPGNYNLSRVDDGTFAFGQPGDGEPPEGYIYDPETFTNSVVNGEYSGYSAFINNTVTTPPPLPEATVTNLPGRVQIFADNLDLTRTRIRGEGEIRINAKNLVGNQGAVIDAENLSFSLLTTGPTLTMTNLVKESVDRVRGNVYAWSGLFSNQVTYIISSNYNLVSEQQGEATVTNLVLEPITNVSSVAIHVLLFDASRVLTELPVTVWDLQTFSPNVVLDDPMTVVQSLYFAGESLTINNRLTLSGRYLNEGSSILGGAFFAVTDFVGTNVPNLKYFTNNGVFSIPSSAHFGDDRLLPYRTFVNTGEISTISMSIKADYLENSGTLNSTGGLRVAATTARFEGGVNRGWDTTLTANTVKISNYTMEITGRLFLDVTQSLSDSGPEAGNLITLQNGVELRRKPTSGDLLGTTIQSSAPNFASVSHIWAGEDRGPVASGYVNNAAVGSLVLGPVGRGMPEFLFQPAGVRSALYVDFLDLGALETNLVEMLEIAPNMTIYYATARLGFEPPPGPGGVPQSPEEYLNGMFEGRLRWVSGYAGANSSVAVVVDGKTVMMNVALRNSRTTDSDEDGVPNYFDATPLGGGEVAGAARPSVSATIGSNGPQGRGLAISWNAAPKSAYRVEYADDLNATQWSQLNTYTNSASQTQRATVWDMKATQGVTQRFYRVGPAGK